MTCIFKIFSDMTISREIREASVLWSDLVDVFRRMLCCKGF